ncbi:amino acid racemase [Pseudohalocynthiibacter aestuariivivens]|nr:amino acid racemase [Pseudohalocynthiibacter aestuariivivens]QIE47095.1 amino acid racemase [Pseudohalocynthiibacter aestuariivivens]
MRPVGILGGMGPEATILLMQKVLEAVPARDDGDHIPLIVHQNPQVPSRIAALIEGRGQDPGPVLAQMARDLQAAGAAALAMPCNTAHHYAGTVRSASELPFLDMLALSAETLQAGGATRIGMLASPATHLTGVFDAPFAAHGLTPVWLEDEAELLAIIRAVKAGEDIAGLKPRLAACGAALRAQGANHLLVACTELSLMTDALDSAGPVTDTLDCLVQAIAGFSRGDSMQG